jgi:hypothetical protein
MKRMPFSASAQAYGMPTTNMPIRRSHISCSASNRLPDLSSSLRTSGTILIMLSFGVSIRWSISPLPITLKNSGFGQRHFLQMHAYPQTFRSIPSRQNTTLQALRS